MVKWKKKFLELNVLCLEFSKKIEESKQRKIQQEEEREKSLIKLQEEERKREDARRQEQERLAKIKKEEEQKRLAEKKKINYLEINMKNVSKMNPERNGVINGDLVIKDDDNNLHEIIFTQYNGLTEKITSKKIADLTIENTNNIIEGKTLIGIIDGGEDVLDHYILPHSRIEELKSFYEKVTANNRIRRKKFNNMLYSVIQNMMQSSEIKRICLNFITKTNPLVFLDLEYIKSLERCLLLASHIGKDTLYTFNEAISDTQALEEVKNYFNDSFVPLLKILTPKCNFPKNNDGLVKLDESLCIIWKFIRVLAKNHFSELFNSEYGNHFKNIEQLTLENCIYIYTEIDTIETLSLKNIGYFTYYMMQFNKFSSYEDPENFPVFQVIISNKLKEILEYKKLQRFEEELSTTPTNAMSITINDLDLMSGIEFENFIATLFQKYGYSVNKTKVTGDQGIDLIIEKNGYQKIGIQAKCYSSSVGNKAVQEIVAGLKYYDLEKGIVITNNYFTNSAIELAHSNNIILWDRNILKEKLTDLFQSERSHIE